MDYFFHGENLSDEEKEIYKQKQKDGFFWQLDLAQKLKLPVIIHCREA
ncbi:MAG: hydrolase TatD, partial [Candidatus Infernicultor aquiphilus]